MNENVIHGFKISRGKVLGVVVLLALAYVLSHLLFPPKVAPPAATAPEISVETMKPESVMVWNQYSGRMTAVDQAEIRPEISGRITEIRFKDGQSVEAGDVLIVIDPRPYEATVARAEANLASAKTSAALARLELDRAEGLIKEKAIAQTIYDQRNSQNKVAQDAVEAAEAELKTAQVNLDYAYVKAPIGGRMGRAEITVGNRVEAGPNAPVMTSIVSSDGIYADFEVDEQTYMRAIHDHASNHASEQKIPVSITVLGNEDHPYMGTIFTFDNRIVPGSGTIRARAKFANEDGGLVPGMFVTVNMASSGETTALLVPERAVSNDQSKQFVFVVGADNKVAYRAVTLGAEVGNRRIVTSGLTAGERVVVDGLMRVQPDGVITPKEVVSTPEVAAHAPAETTVPN